jgi:hypothetical protein
VYYRFKFNKLKFLMMLIRCGCMKVMLLSFIWLLTCNATGHPELPLGWMLELVL